MATQLPAQGPIRVRATRMGFYDHARRRVDDVFDISGPEAFSERWMVLENPRTRTRITTAQTALKAQTQEQKEANALGRANEGQTSIEQQGEGQSPVGAADVLFGDRKPAQ